MHIIQKIMKWLLLIFFIHSVQLINCFRNPYPRYNFYNDNDDPGEPVYLTPFIESGNLIGARKAAFINHPEMNKIVEKAYSGYLTVDKKFNSNMFFWYFQAKTSPETAPVVLWLQGGPGATSLFGLFTENGPFSVSTNKTLLERKFSWHINHHLIYIDNPVGTGFSFTENDDGYARNEIDVGVNLFEALQQFFTIFSELQHNDFYVTGESYAGKYVPAIGHQIYKNSKQQHDGKIKINLKGLAIGNGLSDPGHQLKYGDYLYQLGLIDFNGLNEFHEYEKRGRTCIAKKDFKCAFNVFDELLNMDQTVYNSLFKNLTGFDMYFNYLKTKDDDNNEMGEFLQSSSTRRAIHVGNNSFHDAMDGDNKVEKFLINDVMDSVAVWVSELLAHYNVLIYNGQLDIIVAYPLTENYLHHLTFDGSKDYKTAPRIIWKVDNEIAGYVKKAGKLTEVLVRNAGHMVPADQPKWTMDLLMRFTSQKSFH